MNILDVLQKRLSYGVSTPAFIPVLVPMFLIISSSVYPAIISAIENKEIHIISEAAAELAAGRNVVDSGRYHAHMQELRSSIATQSSSPTPMPIAPTITSKDPIMMQPQSKDDNMMQVTSIDAGKAVHTVWSDDTSGNNEILYKRDGADYDPTTINLSNTAGTSFNSAIAVSGNNVYVVWNDDTPGNAEIFYRRSADGGATFSPTINISNNGGQSLRPDIAISGNNIHVVWDDNTPGNFDILYKRSTDGGATFTGPTKNISGNTGISFQSKIAASGSNVHVVWQDETPGNSDILYRRSIDGGSTFPNIIKNLSSNAAQSIDPAIALSGNIVHAVWADRTPGNFDIFYRRSLDGGITFPNIIKNLSSNVNESIDPAIAASGDSTIHVVWNGFTTEEESDIFYRRSTNGGDSFTDPIKNLSGNAGTESSEPAISLSSNIIYVVWSDRPLPSGNLEILYRTSSNNGATFPSLLTNLSANTGASRVPAVAAS